MMSRSGRFSASSSSSSSSVAAFAVVGAVASLAVVALGWFSSSRRRSAVHGCCCHNSESSSAYENQIGDTPCILLPNLSQVMNCEIYVKMESANPGSTGKDRAALAIIQAAEREGRLPPPSRSTTTAAAAAAATTTRSSSITTGDAGIALQSNMDRVDKDLNTTLTVNTNHDTGMKRNKNAQNGRNRIENEALYDRLIVKAMQRSVTGGLIVEGTSGSTGISLATLAATRGHACLVVLPDDQAREKTALLETLGAVTYTVPPASIASPRHYVNIAQSLCRRAGEGHHIAAIWGNQFENPANWQIHYQTTGPEIWRQCRPHYFVMSAGTGGTLAGVARYLKEQQQQQQHEFCSTILVDPPGSVLYAKIEHGVAFCVEQREQQLKRHRYDTVAEGIGLDRVTANVAAGLPYIDEAVAVTDQQAVDLAHWMLRHEGLLLGSSSAMNLVGACRVALQQQQQKPSTTTTTTTTTRICTVICDTGQRHLTRFWNRDFIVSRGLEWPGDDPVGRDGQLFASI